MVCGLCYKLVAHSNVVYVINIGRLLSGFIYGVNHITIIMHAADNSAPEIRGTVLRWIAYTKLFMLFLATGIAKLTYTNVDVYFGFGILYVLVGFVTLLLIRFCVYDSFVHALEKAPNDGRVLDNVIKIRDGCREPERIRHELYEMKTMLVEDNANGKNIFANGNIRPLLLVIGGRALSALFNNVPLLVTEASWIYSSFSEVSSEFFFVTFFLQLVFGLITIGVAELISFNKFLYASGILWSVALFSLLFVIENVVADVPIKAYKTAIVGYTLIALGIEAISYNQLSEAFPSTKRAWSIVVVTFVECLAYLIILAFSIFVFPYLNILITVGIVAISVLLFIYMPNAHGVTLRNARNLFNKSLNTDATRLSRIRNK